ncbi:hypothetical protein Hdeb2414_s0033g00724881 [Helianthus debilis subsp. tardiflorus]
MALVVVVLLDSSVPLNTKLCLMPGWSCQIIKIITSTYWQKSVVVKTIPWEIVPITFWERFAERLVMRYKESIYKEISDAIFGLPHKFLRLH